MNVCNASWFAVHTKPRQEQIAFLNLERQSFDCYLPMAVDAFRREPLFPRYLFLNADPQRQNLAVVRSTRGVTGLVRSGFELTKLPGSIIAGLKARMHPATGLIPLDSMGLNSGDKVRVFNGPFAELEGIFREHRGRDRSLLLLEILGRETAVEIDARFLQRVS